MSDRAMAPFTYLWENLFFCLNATLPIFFTMLLGYGFRKIGLLDEKLYKENQPICLPGALPLLLLEDLWSADFQTLWDGKICRLLCGYHDWRRTGQCPVFQTGEG